MLIQFGFAAVIAAALSLLVLASIGFGHRYADASAKFLDKSKTDELNDIRMAVRDENTMPTVEKLWKFLHKTNVEMRRVGATMVVRDLLYDINRRKTLNSLVNELSLTFRKDMEIRKSWESLKRLYGELGKSLYELAAVAGVGGYPLLIFSATSFSDTFSIETEWLWAVPVFIGAIIFIRCLLTRNKLLPYLRLYQDAVKEYLTDVVRVQR